MKGVINENTCGYLVSAIMPAALQIGALSVMICTQESTPTSSMVLSAKFKEWTMQGVEKIYKRKKSKYKFLYNTNK